MSSNWRDEKLNDLFDAVLTLKTRDEAAAFLRDLCTINELQTLAERWEVARLVNEEVPYRKINEQTGVSTATVTRVAHWLHHGEGGYRTVLNRV
jgi:TrpR-related protein YerC/YecD